MEPWLSAGGAVPCCITSSCAASNEDEFGQVAAAFGRKCHSFAPLSCICQVPEWAMASVCSGLPRIASTFSLSFPTFCPIKTQAQGALAME
jgi:hypothetical protein